MNRTYFRDLTSQELQEIEGGGAVGTAVKIIKKGYNHAKEFVKGFFEEVV